MNSYPGGKAGAGVYQKIISQQPPHDVYIEPFLGGGAVMRRKLPAQLNIGIDADGDVISRARALCGEHQWLAARIAGQRECAHFEFLWQDGIDWLRAREWSPNELVYCDPPYMRALRRSYRQMYRWEMSDRGHEDLLKLLLTLPCMVQVSGYWGQLYASLLSTWRTVSFQAQTRGGKSATEWLWMNYAEPVELHDFRYLGRDFRERERLKRLRSRWLARLARMGGLERGALLSAMGAAWPPRRVS